MTSLLDTFDEVRARGRAAMKKGELDETEMFWKDLQPWLEERGYKFRPRYQPGWKASWLDGSKPWHECEDSLTPLYSFILDAIRISDGSLVVFKRVTPSEDPNEVHMARLLSTEPLLSDPKNHCVPIYDILEVPGYDDAVLLVMPLLYSFDLPEFDTIGEIVDFFKQLFEGMQFLHQHNIAHRDCKHNNVMASSLPLFAKPPHPCDPFKSYDFSTDIQVRSSRTRTPIKYYLIDFGLSQVYPSKEGNLEKPPWGGFIKEVPEFSTIAPCDPFPVDVFCLGYLIRTRFLEEYLGMQPKANLEFMDSLVEDMTQADPQSRPNMDEVMDRFVKIVDGLSFWTLRSRVVEKGAKKSRFREVKHWTKQLILMLRFTPAIPRS